MGRVSNNRTVVMVYVNTREEAGVAPSEGRGSVNNYRRIIMV